MRAGVIVLTVLLLVLTACGGERAAMNDLLNPERAEDATGESARVHDPRAR